MGAESDHERIWETLPAQLEPTHFELRRAFLIEHVASGERVLDVGCGEGRFASALLDAGASVVGIDVAEEPLRRASARDHRLDLRLVPAAGGWELPDAGFDVVWAGEVIEHVADTAGWLSEVRRVLRPQGRLLLSTPNHSLLSLLRLALWPPAFAAHFNPLSDHLRFYTRGLLERVLSDFRFEAVEVSTAAGPPLARALLLARARRTRW